MSEPGNQSPDPTEQLPIKGNPDNINSFRDKLVALGATVAGGLLLANSIVGFFGNDEAGSDKRVVAEPAAAYIGDGYDFEAGTSCGPNDTRDIGKQTYIDNEDHIQSYYNETRLTLFEDRPELAASRVEWIEQNASWQKDLLGDKWDPDDPVSTMQAWVELGSVVEAGETVETNNWGCHKNADGTWTIFDVPEGSLFEKQWPKGTPMIVVDPGKGNPGIEFRADGSATVYLDSRAVHIPAGQYVRFVDIKGKDQIVLAIFTCDNPQTPAEDKITTTTTIEHSGTTTTTTTTKPEQETTTTPVPYETTTTTVPDKVPKQTPGGMTPGHTMPPVEGEPTADNTTHPVGGVETTTTTVKPGTTTTTTEAPQVAPGGNTGDGTTGKPPVIAG